MRHIVAALALVALGCESSLEQRPASGCVGPAEPVVECPSADTRGSLEHPTYRLVARASWQSLDCRALTGVWCEDVVVRYFGREITVSTLRLGTEGVSRYPCEDDPLAPPICSNDAPPVCVRVPTTGGPDDPCSPCDSIAAGYPDPITGENIAVELWEDCR